MSEEPSPREIILIETAKKLARLNRVAEEQLMTRQEVVKAIRKMERSLMRDLKIYNRTAAAPNVREHIEGLINEIKRAHE